MVKYAVYNAETSEKTHKHSTSHAKYENLTNSLQDNLQQHTDGILTHMVIRVSNIKL